MNDLIFYIYTPPWVEWSAGTKVLHFLCDRLNSNGWESYLCIHGPRLKTSEVNENLRTPVIDLATARKHRSANKQVVVVYPEGIVGNPLGGDTIVRWILNYPGLLGGEQTFTSSENIWAYSKSIADAYRLTNNLEIPILFVPAIRMSEIDINLGFPSLTGEYELMYAQKYRALGGKPEVMSGSNVIEITRFNRDSTSRLQTLNLIKHASKVHIFENTTIATEAALFGVPIVCHPNNFFSSLISSHELGESGVSWHPNPGLPSDQETSRHMLNVAWATLDDKISSCISLLNLNEISKEKKLDIVIPRRNLASKHLFDRGTLLLRQKGIWVFLRFASNYLKRWLR